MIRCFSCGQLAGQTSFDVVCHLQAVHGWHGLNYGLRGEHVAAANLFLFNAPNLKCEEQRIFMQIEVAEVEAQG